MQQDFALRILSCLWLTLLASNAMGGSPKACQVKFHTTGQPVLVTIEGKSESPCTGEFAWTPSFKGVFKLPLDKLNTGIPLRNKHLRDNYLHTDKYPETVVTIDGAEGLVENVGRVAGKFQGSIELHGVKKPIEDGKYSMSDKKMNADFSLLLPDFGIEQPSFMGIKVVDRVHVEVEFMIDEH